MMQFALMIHEEKLSYLMRRFADTVRPACCACMAKNQSNKHIYIVMEITGQNKYTFCIYNIRTSNVHACIN